MAEAVIVKAEFQSSALLVKCPGCGEGMRVLYKQARCENDGCVRCGVAYWVEVPEVEVGLRIAEGS